jgi:tetratricopeptide (TPR) repeat protein
MNQDLIAQRCEAMRVEELVRAVTVERGENTVQFREVALRELDRRGTGLAVHLDRAKVRRNDGEEGFVPIREALAYLSTDLAPWDALLFTSCLGDTFVVQRGARHWVAHHYEGDGYGGSFLVENAERAGEILSLFLRLENWADQAGQRHHLDSWEPLVNSDSRELLQTVCADLDGEGIPYIIQVPRFAPDSAESMTLLVSPEDIDEANDLIDETEEAVEDLYVQAEELAETQNRAQELEVYEILAGTDPDNPAVHYNRGGVLLELERWEQAADSLVEAVALGLKTVESNLELNPQKESRGLGGVMEIYALLLRKVTSAALQESAAPSPRYPDHIDDADILLQRLLERLPESLKILHCLASIARLRNDADTAEARYRRILEIDPDDQVAYFNLGYLHSEKSDGGD